MSSSDMTFILWLPRIQMAILWQPHRYSSTGDLGDIAGVNGWNSKGYVSGR